MNDILLPGLALLAGGALGIFFFGGLWWTVHRGLASPMAALWFGLSMLLRTGVTLAGFYAVGHGDWHRLVACLLGFVLARLAVTRWLGTSDGERAP